jgi:hypothetical protein
MGDWVWEAHPLAPGDDLYRDAPSWTPFQSEAHAHAAGAAWPGCIAPPPTMPPPRARPSRW